MRSTFQRRPAQHLPFYNTPEEERKGKLMQMNNDALKRILRDSKLKIGGNKVDLVERIFDSLKLRHGDPATHPNREQLQPQQPQEPQQQP
jgi:hypothetical protein